MDKTPSRAEASDMQGELDRIYRAWDRAFAHHDTLALVAMYAEDAVIQSPLIPRLMHRTRAFCRGRDQIRTLYEAVLAWRPQVHRSRRTAYLTDGEKITAEYARAAPDDVMLSCTEVMEIRDGLIRSHRGVWF